MLEYRLNRRFVCQLPEIRCQCGNVQHVFMSGSISCVACHKFFHTDAFQITKSIEHRLHYHKGGKCYVAGT